MDEQQQQDTMRFPETVGQPVTSQLNPSLAAFLIQCEKDITKYCKYLGGETPNYNDEGEITSWDKPEKNLNNEYVKGREPTLNLQGVYEVRRYLDGITSKIIEISQVEEEQCRQDLLDNVLSLYMHLFLNYRRYNLKPKNFDILRMELTNFAEFSLGKAKNKFMGELIHPKYTTQEHIFTQRQAEQKKGALQSFVGW